MLPGSTIRRAVAAFVLSALPFALGSGVAFAASTAATGYVTPPYWAAYTRDGVALLAYAKVASASLGTAGGPKGSQTEVPVGVRLVTAKGTTLRSLITVPKGDAVLSVAATEDGVVVTAGPLADVTGVGAPSARPWEVIVSDLGGGQGVAWRYTPGHAAEAPPALGASGQHWAAITQAGSAKKALSQAVLAEGSFARPGSATIRTAATDMLPTAVAVEPNGDVGLYAIEFSGTRLHLPRFGAAAHVALIWTGHGVLVPAPGGFLTVEGNSVARPESGGRSLLLGKLPKDTAVVSLAGDGEAVVLLLSSRKGTFSTWAIGPAPKSLHTVLAIRPSDVFLTAAGLVGVTLHVKGRVVTVTYAAVAGS